MCKKRDCRSSLFFYVCFHVPQCKVRMSTMLITSTITAAGMKAGLSDIIFGECSCSRMVALYQKAGRWMEDDAYKPQIGDIIMYRWDDGSNYATTDNTSSPNHVGLVAEVNGSIMTIIEGNKGEKVATRSLFVNGRYIRGYCLPDYTSKSKEDDDMLTQEQFDVMMEDYLARRAQEPATMPDQVAEAVALGISTNGDRPRAFLTREEGMVMAKAAVKAALTG